MIEIKEEDLELMKVWEKDIKRKYNRYVFAKYKNEYLAVDSERDSREEAIKALEKSGLPIVSVWPHAEPIKTKLTAVVKSAEEITGIKGTIRFAVRHDDGVISYTGWMNDLAGKQIEVTPLRENEYEGKGCRWLKNWLKDFREEEE